MFIFPPTHENEMTMDLRYSIPPYSILPHICNITPWGPANMEGGGGGEEQQASCLVAKQVVEFPRLVPLSKQCEYGGLAQLVVVVSIYHKFLPQGDHLLLLDLL